MSENKIEPDLYKHYKGKLYKVKTVVRHSESLEELVLYEALYENELGQFWVRPLDMFTGYLEDGRKRFEKIENE